jgi:hypothetical protein
MSDLSMLTILIQASATVKNRSGDSSIHGYVDTQNNETHKDPDFVLLDCLSDILVQDSQVLAASYDNAFTVVIPISEPESELDLDDPDCFDMDFPPHKSVSSATTLRPLNAAVVPNPNDRKNGCQSNRPLEEIRGIAGRRSLWDWKDPLGNALK